MQVVTFVVENLLCGVEVSHVQEVLRQPDLTPIPLAPAATPGLIHLRGQILTAVDLRAIMELRPRDPEKRVMSVILRTDTLAASLMVDRIGDVMDVSAECHEPVPAHWQGAVRNLTTAVCQNEKGLLLILDTARIYEAAGGEQPEES